MFAWLPISRSSLIVVGFFTLFAVACGASAPPTDTPTPTATPTTPPPTATPTTAPPATTAGLPDTSGAAVWDYLQGIDYQGNWELWPGKGEKYEGNEPHGMLLTTYLNPAALDALNGKAGSMPDGAILVKENYTPDGVLDATTVMFKVTGYNPEHNDWFFTKVGADNAVQAEGKVQGCQSCHLAVKDNDYIFTGPLK